MGILSDTTYELHSGEAERPASSLSTDLPGAWSSMIEGYSGVLIGLPAPLR